MPFIPYRKEGGSDAGENREFLIDNSATIILGEAVTVIAGVAARATVGSKVMGVAIAFSKRTGTATNDPTIALGADAAGSVSGTRSGNRGVIGSDSYAAAADNETVDNVMVKVVIDRNQEYYNDTDASLTYANIGNYFNLVSAGVIDGSDNSTSNGQFICMDIDPHNDADASKGVFRIAEHQFDAYTQD